MTPYRGVAGHAVFPHPCGPVTGPYAIRAAAERWCRRSLRWSRRTAVGASSGLRSETTPGERQMRILVSGAGIAGLSAAIDLGAGGHDVTIVERTNHPRVNGSPSTFAATSPSG